MVRRRKVSVKEEESAEPKFKKPATKKDQAPAKKFKKEPGWMNGEASNVAQLILSIQKTDVNNAKVMKELTKLYKKIGHDAFMTVFFKVVTVFLIREESDEFTPRVLKFIGNFVASFGEEVEADGGSHPIITQLFKELLSITSKQWHVRARICTLVTNTMNSFSQRAEIDENIMDGITDRMLTTFIKDISPVVRQNAIMALQRLQDPDNNEDPVTKVYIYHMETDPISKVRQAVITAIAKKQPIFPHILDRLQDNDEKVRRHTYLQMASVPVKSYKIVDRIKFLQAGLFDRSEMVKKVVNNMFLPNWIASYDNDYAEFVKAVKLDSSDSELISFRALAQDALSAIFKKRKVTDLINFLKLTTEETGFKNCLSIDRTNCLEWLVVWKMAIKAHQTYSEGKQKEDFGQEEDEESDEALNESISNVNILPELSVYCDYFEKFLDETKLTAGSEAKYQKLNFSHCIILLLEIAQLNDFSDELGCNRLQQIMKKILAEHDVSEYVIKEIAHVMELLVNNVEKRLNFFNEIITTMLNLGMPSEYSRKSIIEDLIAKADINTKVKANSIKMEMMELKEKETRYVELKKYGEAQKVTEAFAALNQQLVDLLLPLADESGTSQSLMDCMSSAFGIKKITPVEILKNLRICYYAIMMKGVKMLTPEQLKIYNNFVRFHLEASDVLTRVWALKTATAYSLLYESLAKEVYVVLKGQMFKSYHVLVWEATIGCIVDLLLRYSIEKMDAINELNEDMTANLSTQNRSKKGGRTLYIDDGEDQFEDSIVEKIDIVQMLTHVLDNNSDIKVHKACTIGFCKLILHGQYSTREIVSKFLIAYFNPATDAEINQVLGIFFESIVRMKKQESLHDALIPTLVTLLEAPYDSPLREVKQETVIKYVIGATRPIFCSNGLNLHNTLGLKLIELMRENPENKEILKVFSKELLTLEIGDDPLLKKDMIVHIENLMKNITVDVRTRKAINDFREMLNGTYKPPLKFSSTAMTTTMENEDAGVFEEVEDDEKENEEEGAAAGERFASDEILDVSLSTIKMPRLILNVTKLNMSKIQDELNDSKDSPNVTVSSQIIPATPSNVKEIEESQIDTSENVTTLSQSITLPETQEEEDESESSSEEDLEETVIESSIVNEAEIPETPKSVSRKMIALPHKRQLELSLNKSINSPLRKNPRNGASPKSLEVTERPLRPSRSAPITPKTLATPTSRLSTSSTPVSEVKTRRQAKENAIQSLTLTRSASRKLKVVPIVDTEKANTSAKRTAQPKSPVLKKAQEEPDKPSKPVASKVAKKLVLPVPTKTSAMRTAKAETTISRPKRKTSTKLVATLARSSSQVSIKSNATKRTRNQASGKSGSEAKSAEAKQRPRWN